MNKKNHENILYELSSDSKNRIKLFREISPNKQGTIFLKLSKRIQQHLLHKLDGKEILKFLSYLDPDEISDILLLFKGHQRDRIIKKLGRDRRDKVEFLLRFNPKTAAGIMSLDYIELDKDMNFEIVSKLVRKHEERTGKFPTLLVVEEGFLVGELQPHTLAIARKKEKLKKYIKKIASIEYDKSEDEIIHVFRKNPHNKIVVLDKDYSILGLIYSDDVLKLIEKKTIKTIGSLAGIKEEEDVFDSVFIKVKNRYPWLITNLCFAFIAAGVVSLFEEKIAALTLLAVYMPIVAALGGNAGTQALAVVVRGLAMKKIDLKTSSRVIFRELGAGFVNGVLIGLLVAIVALLWNKNPMFGLVIGLAMIVNLVFSGMFGAIAPLIMTKLGKDPATSSTIFITTATDIFGFGFFLGLGSLLL